MSHNFPLFIVGCPRSGTTLMRLMFDSHPQIAIPDETGLISLSANQKIIGVLEKIKKINLSNLREVFGDEIYDEFIKRYNLKKSNPREIIEFLMMRYSQKEGKKYWGEKNPRNSRFIWKIRDLYPNSTIIFMIWDPRAVVASSKRYAQKTNKRDFWMDSNINKSIKLWRRSIKEGLSQKKYRIIFVKYENLVQSPEKILKKLCKSIGIRYSQQMLNYHKKQRNKSLKDWHKETSKKINTKNINKWKKELTKEEIQLIEKSLGKYMNLFDYK